MKSPYVPDSLPPSENRTIRVIGSIDEDAYIAFTEHLSELENDYSLKPVHVELNSNGGETLQGLAIAERIRNSSCVVHITVYGNASSAASLILASGDYRSISANSVCLVHEDCFKPGKMTSSDLRSAADQADKDEAAWATMFEELTGTPSSVWRTIAKKSTILTAKECYQLGMVDNVLKGKKRANSLR